MNYTKLTELIGKIFTPNEPNIIAEPINDVYYNKIKITWRFQVKKTLRLKNDFIEIIHQLEIDMVSLIENIKRKGHDDFSKEFALIAIALNYDKSIMLISNNQYEELADLVIQKRGEALAYKNGI